MKVTAILEDELINDVRHLTQGKNTTEAIKIALSDWRKTQKLRELNKLVANKPLSFNLSASKLRFLSR